MTVKVRRRIEAMGTEFEATVYLPEDVWLTKDRREKADKLDRILKVEAEATGSGSGEIRACSYEQIQLYSSGGTTFDWWPAEYLNDPSISTPIADPPAGTSTIFYVEVSGACGLTDTATVTVTKFPHVEAQYSVDLGK